MAILGQGYGAAYERHERKRAVILPSLLPFIFSDLIALITGT
jgi:hypothetical protein